MEIFKENDVIIITGVDCKKREELLSKSELPEEYKPGLRRPSVGDVGFVVDQFGIFFPRIQQRFLFDPPHMTTPMPEVYKMTAIGSVDRQKYLDIEDEVTAGVHL